MTVDFLKENGLLEPLAGRLNKETLKGFLQSHNFCGYSVSSGLDRCCLAFEEDNEVLKFDINGADSCCAEKYYYTVAQRFGVEEVILPLRELYTFEETGITLYAQPKVQFTLEEARDSWLDSKLKSKIYASIIEKDDFQNMAEKLDTSVYWLMFVYARYGKKFCHKLVKWALTCGANDLHPGNIGFIGKKPYIFDYAGFIRPRV